MNLSIGTMWVCYILLVFVGTSCALYTDPHCKGDTGTIVHLFEWKWTDIEKECEYLAKAGYCAVQTSVATEHKIGEDHSWTERYQAASYVLKSRSGTEDQFARMVKTCNDHGVRIIVDVVLNRLARDENGVGYAGTSFNSKTFLYPGILNLTAANFHAVNDCSDPRAPLTSTSSIDDIRKCRVEGCPDLDQSQPFVRKKMDELLNRLEAHGVAGFRVGEAKNMDPEDLKVIYGNAHNVQMSDRPVIINEVFNTIADAVKPEEYYDLGLVTEFRYSQRIGDALTKKDYSKLCDIFNSLIKEENALIFVDNHETQRGRDSSGSTILTYQKPSLYKLAQAFTLASGYGTQRVMSSYFFTDAEAGPPMDVSHTITDVTVNEDGACDGGWVCEHRWPLIAGVVKYSNRVRRSLRHSCKATPTTVSFMRGDDNLFWMTADENLDSYEVSTELEAGQYCNMLTDCKDKYTVDASGSVIINSSMDGVVALFKDPNQPATIAVTDSTTELSMTDALTTTEEPLNTQEFTTEELFANQDLTTEELLTTGDIRTEELLNTKGFTTEDPKAMGAATGAFFTNDFKVTADGLNQRTAVDGLLISESFDVYDQGTTIDSSNNQWPTDVSINIQSTKDGSDNIQWATDESNNNQWTTDGSNSNNIHWTSDGSDYNQWTTDGLNSVLWTTDGSDNSQWTTDGSNNIHWTTDGSNNNQWTTDESNINQWNTDGSNTNQLTTDGSSSHYHFTTNGVNTEVVSTLAPTPSGPNWQRTVILVEKQTSPGQDLFLRGGLESSHTTGGCSSADYQSNPCAIPIRHRGLNMTDETPGRDSWAKGDNYLDWFGPETDQGTFKGAAAQGTPAQWTTNDPSKKYFNLLNKYGDQYWLVDVDMDCDKSYDGFFEFKGVLSNGWEVVSNANNDCTGDGAVPFPFHDTNHIGRCGYLNVYHWGTGQCEIHQLEYVATTTQKQSGVTTLASSYGEATTVTEAGHSVDTNGAVTGQPSDLQTTPTGPDWRRTVLLVEKQPNSGEDVFFRGGIDQRLLNNTKACETDNYAQNPCVIPIRHRDLNMTDATPARNAWAEGDNYLDWYGAEVNQGTDNGVVAVGTPGQLTSNNSANQYYNLINKYGDNYWIVDVDMDCSRSYGGLFEFDGVLSSGWETGLDLDSDCEGDGAVPFPYHDGNHIGRCGYVNVYHWGTGRCEIHPLDDDVTTTPPYSSTQGAVDEFTTADTSYTAEDTTEWWPVYDNTFADSPLNTTAAPTVAPDWQRTVILLQKQAGAGQQVFLRGGIDPAHVKDNSTCETKDFEKNACAIPISHRILEMSTTSPARDTWAKGDDFLNWKGPEFHQGEYNRVIAQGTPGQITSNRSEDQYFNLLNKYGDDFWIVDVDMDCSRSNEGFFEFYGILPPSAELVTDLTNDCTGDGAVPFPYHDANHIGRCGYINVYEWERGQCEIHPFEVPTTTEATTEPTTPLPTTATESTWKRTVILLQKPADVGEHVFIRGGIDPAHVSDNTTCQTKEYEKNACAIPIRHLSLEMSTTSAARDTWAKGDNFLDWNGPEFYQNEYNRVIPQGTPGQITSNRSEDQFFNILNRYGDDFWIVDVDMDCSRSNEGFFEFYGVLPPSAELVTDLTNDCTGDGAVPFPYHDANHIGRCGYINVYEWERGQCEIHPFEGPTTTEATTELTTPLPTTPIDTTWQRTVILLQKPADVDEYVFIRGGIDPAYVSDNTTCETKDYTTNECAIPIRHRALGMSASTIPRDTWATGDEFLDWNGPEYYQKDYNRVIAQGTPGQVTTNSSSDPYYNILNRYGDDYWLVDVDMNCDRTSNGFFEFYGVQSPSAESFINLTNDCTGDGAVPFPYHDNNHIGRCGYVNVYHWGTGQCEIHPFQGPTTPVITTELTTTLPTTPVDLTWQRTVILVQKKADDGEDVFIRGGIDPSHVSDNTTCDRKEFDVNECVIPIKHRTLGMTNVSPAREAWVKGDSYLDWSGPEFTQQLYNRVIAQGTPGQVTSNNSANQFYNSLNRYGDDYWLVDVDMMCTRTDNGLFEFYAVQAPGAEGTSNLSNDCTGDGAVPFPYHDNNHIGRCGYVNVYHWGTGQCEIRSFHSLAEGGIDIIG
ncbi:unnamed protein product [Lymnaea stagnalis]|uniref:alpha-amylase n=1 Tax=Lymnaea stagnalis TaxID=6523 RepID=A0AAV2GXD1_LYMST